MGFRGLLIAAAALVLGAQTTNDQLLRLRTLGKAFYENPTTQAQAVDQFKRAWQLNPRSATDRLNYALALLRAGNARDGMTELEATQKMDPKLPHTWFNLGIEHKKMGETDRAIAELEQMARLVPGEPITQYNLGVLYKAAGRAAEANAKFALSASLDPNFAAPHFQLFNFHRQQGQADRAKEELARFQELKRRHEEAGTGNEDVEWSLYSEVYDWIDPRLAADPRPAVAVTFAPVPLSVKVDPANSTLHVIDLDGTGSTDLLVVSTGGISVFRKGATMVPQPGLAGLKGILAAVPGDYNNDGLVDLCVLTTAGPVLFNNTKAGFVRAANVKLPAERFESAVWIDYDHDYDLDLVLLGSTTRLLRNQLPAGFVDRTADIPFAAGQAVSGIATRVIPDTKAHDLILTYRDHAAVLYKDRLGGKYEAQPLAAVPAGATALVAADINNDSAFDLVWNSGAAVNVDGRFNPVAWAARGSFALADLEGRGTLDAVASGWVYRNESQSRFAAPAKAAGLPDNTTALAAADFDGDGRTDLAAVLSDGTVVRSLNRTPAKSSWVRVRINGVKNLKLASGTEIEVKAGPFYQKQVYRGYPLNFGLRATTAIDTIRITWPNGLIQNETQPKANTTLVYQEAQRLSGSCPLIWTWNGSKYEYITDVLGVAPLGAASGDGSYFPVDHDEFITIAGESLRERDGRLEVRITEELSEVSYLDQIELIAVDHPASTEVFSNDKFKSPPFPEFRLYGAAQRVYPRRALEDGARDVTAAVLRRDRRYPDGFQRDLQGVAKMHTLELNFGRAAAANQAVLILHGWVDWADGSTFLAQSQVSRAGLVTPKLQVRNARGEWQTVIEDLGMPAGKPKTIAVDLTGKFLSASREIRIVTNLCVYWDEIFLSESSAAPQTRLTPLRAATTDLRFRGFARNVVHPLRKQPEMFYYEDVSITSMWNPTPGRYTRYGEVTGLLDAADDKLVILGSGDELQLQFDARALPELPRGWRRDYLLKVDGWAKDRDANTAYSQTVEPLPFHGMTAYPYPAGEHYPDTPEYRQYREQYNTRPALRLLRALHETGTHSKQGN